MSLTVVVCLCREYGTIDDVDLDLHINISFLDVSSANNMCSLPCGFSYVDFVFCSGVLYLEHIFFISVFPRLSTNSGIYCYVHVCVI